MFENIDENQFYYRQLSNSSLRNNCLNHPSSLHHSRNYAGHSGGLVGHNYAGGFVHSSGHLPKLKPKHRRKPFIKPLQSSINNCDKENQWTDFPAAINQSIPAKPRGLSQNHNHGLENVSLHQGNYRQCQKMYRKPHSDIPPIQTPNELLPPWPKPNNAIYYESGGERAGDAVTSCAAWTESPSPSKMDSKNYDEIRNLTILFFLDRLVDKGQARTLHDLSCQFGTKGFTKEMRQIAGGSQAGLRKFLSQYPSLFSIDGEYVSITCFNNNGNGSSSSSTAGSGSGGSGGGRGSTRDYAQEAVDYFRDKLDQYGAAEVPIKSLLGHRSQASPEVRHISGQHIKEFRDFLVKFPDTFVVHEDYVVLRKHWDMVSEGGANAGGVLERHVPSPPLQTGGGGGGGGVDPQLTAQILTHCRSVIASQGPVPVDQLFGQLSESLACGKLVKSVQDFNVLLKMHSDSFLVKSGMVSLVPQKHQPATALSALTQTTTESRANSTSTAEVHPPRVLNGSGNSPVSVSTPGSPSSRGHLPAVPPPAAQSFKQRLMSHLIKAVADNNAMEQRVYQSPTVPAAGRSAFAAAAAAAATHNSHYSNNNAIQFDVAQMNVRLLRATKLVTKVSDCQAIVANFLRLPTSSAAPVVVSLDAEGINLGPTGPMTLLQIGTVDGQIFIFDLVVCRDMLIEGGLKEVLESPNIVKVVHDCRNDSAALFHQFGVTLQNVFDTQAAHAVLQQQLTGKPVHKVKNISLNNLCRMYGGPVNPKKDQMKKLYRRDQKFWSRRPLTDDMILYAAYDIFALVPTIYEHMKGLLEQQEQQSGGGEPRQNSIATLFRQLCQEEIDMYIKVEDVKQSKKRRKIETEVGELKRKLSAASGKTIVLSNREIRLLRHVDLTEEEYEKLEGSYKVARKLERLQGRNQGAAGGSEGGTSVGGGGDSDSRNRSNADSSEASPEFDDEEYEDEEDDEGEEEEDEDDLLLDDADEEEGDDDESSNPDSSFLGGNNIFGSRGVGAGGGGRRVSPSLEDSIRMVEEFLANERFEGLGLASEGGSRRENGRCWCDCHHLGKKDDDENGAFQKTQGVQKADAGCQTLSTGDIVITRVHFEERGSPGAWAALRADAREAERPRTDATQSK